jgi:hypothetical protein
MSNNIEMCPKHKKPLCWQVTKVAEMVETTTVYDLRNNRSEEPVSHHNLMGKPSQRLCCDDCRKEQGI